MDRDTRTAFAAHTELRPGTRVRQYRLVRALGAGGMGTVYEAEDTRLGRRAALKFLSSLLSRDAHARERLVNEARAASVLDHPNVCTIYEVGEAEDSRVFIAMACYPGRSLRDILASGPIATDQALDITYQTALGLAAAHAAGVVHRDVKPSNIIVTTDGVVKLVDFGIAKVSGVDLTKTGTTVGTMAYMSPEQARGASDERSDLWSLGVVAYEMLTGQRLFSSDHDGGLLYNVLYGDLDLEPLDRLPPSVRKTIERCLQREPNDRYASADLLARDLLEARGEASGRPYALRATSPTSTARASRSSRSRPASAAVLEDTAPSPHSERRSAPALRLAGLGVATVILAVLVWLLAPDRGAPALEGTRTSVGAESVEAAMPTDEAPLEPNVGIEVEPVEQGGAPSRTPATVAVPQRPAPNPAGRTPVATAPPPASPPALQAPPAMGSVVVEVYPAGAAVVAGASGRSGTTLTVPSGRQAVECRGPSGATYETTVTVRPGLTERVACHFEAELRVSVAFPDDVPPGNRYAYVVLDGQRTTTTAPGRLTLAVGTHQVGLVRDGFESAEGTQTIVVAPSDRSESHRLSFALRSQ